VENNRKNKQSNKLTKHKRSRTLMILLPMLTTQRSNSLHAVVLLDATSAPSSAVAARFHWIWLLLLLLLLLLPLADAVVLGAAAKGWLLTR
jgi:hypothetical protein